MLVTRENLNDVCKRFTPAGEYGLDTETNGLRVYHGDRLFSLILSDDSGAYYFNFLTYLGIGELFTLDREETFALLKPAFSNPDSTWYIGNAKFDMSMLDAEGGELCGTVWDTEVAGRLIFNGSFKYGVAALAERYGVAKSQAVDEYIKANRLYTWLKAPGKTKKAKQPHYDRVPFDIIVPYGVTDGEIIRHIGQHQKKDLEEIAKTMPGDKFRDLCANDWQLTKTCYAMEKVGIKIDRAYCQAQYDAEMKTAFQVAERFTQQSGITFKDSNSVLAQAFTEAGEAYPKTAKGNPSFKDDVLAGFKSPLAKLVQDYRGAVKKASTYYANFLYYADSEDIVHANIRTAGTVTARFSYADPNLQNIPRNNSDNPDGAQVRKAFIPRPGYCFVMIDYEQQEYRMMLDYAKQMDVIGKIINEGLDVHTATAKMTGASRFFAKTLNFLLLYGGGAQKLADSLELSLAEAKELKRRYFSAMPQVKKFINAVQAKARAGFVVNWAGRRYFFEDGFDYKAPNHLIQGGGADVSRFALNRLDPFLKPYLSRILVQIHDEILFEIHESELGIVPQLKEIMENVYPYRHLQLTCSVDHSWKSWGDKVAGLPQIQ